MPKDLLQWGKKLGKKVLSPFGETDVLLYYALIAQANEDFLKGKTLATKIWMPAGIPRLIRRGSKQPPIYAQDLENWVDEEFIKRRVGTHLKDAAGGLEGKQAIIWDYFFPRKLCDFFYATNGEGEGQPIERIFIDMDRGKGISREQAAAVAKNLAQMISDDYEFASLAKQNFKFLTPFVSFTGSSFHFLFFLKKPAPNSFYLQNFQYNKPEPTRNFVGRWAGQLAREFPKIKVLGGHEKRPGSVSLDPSQTPSGKLCRVPLGSLHVSGLKEFDGVSVPVPLSQLEKLNENELVSELSSYTPKKVVAELGKLSRLLPRL